MGQPASLSGLPDQLSPLWVEPRDCPKLLMGGRCLSSLLLLAPPSSKPGSLPLSLSSFTGSVAVCAVLPGSACHSSLCPNSAPIFPVCFQNVDQPHLWRSE